MTEARISRAGIVEYLQAVYYSGEMCLMENDIYQHGFTELYPHVARNVELRKQKARKLLSVLDDHFSGKLENLSVLDNGCSTGIISNMLSKRFRNVQGIDINPKRIKHARENFQSSNLQFSVQRGSRTDSPDNTFDIVVCTQVYEHVPDAEQLMAEIYRVLKPGGICYFAAGNRLKILESHYKLPFLSIVPKSLAHLYLRVLGRGKFYFEKHLTLWELRRLVRRFEIIDYTLKIIRDPEKFCATEMIKPGSFRQKISLWVLGHAYWICPTYIWLLRK